MSTAEAIESAVRSRTDRAVSVSRYIHDNPELAFREEKAANVLVEWLEEEGFVVERGVAGLPTAFRAVAGAENGPSVAFLAEYDALRGLGHGCGHNLIASGACLAAISLAEALPHLPGRIIVIGTPAEEGGGGKALEIEAGVFDDVDMALMFHGADRTIVDRPMLAALHYRVTYNGIAAHAAKNPDQGRSALSAAMLLLHAVDAMRAHLSSDSRIHGIIVDGGQAVNVIPERCVLEVQVRAATIDSAKRLGRWFEDSCAAAAVMAEVRVEIEAPAPDYAHLVSNPILAERASRYLSEGGLTPEAAAANEATASTDAGNVSLVVPTLHPFVAVAPRGTASHSEAMRAASIELAAHEAMLAAAGTLARLGADFLVDEAFRTDVQRAFEPF